jgi:hypothetical protein
VNKTPIVIVSNGNGRDYKSKLINEKQFTVEYLKDPIDFEVFVEKVKKYFASMEATHVLVIMDHEIITHKFMRYVTFASTNIQFIDFYQIAGGKFTLNLIRNLFHNIGNVVVIKIVLRLPLTFLKILRKLFSYLPLSPILKNLVISSLNRNYENINLLNYNNLYFSHIFTWSNIRPPLKAFFISHTWLNALAHLQSKPLLTFERANVALARSGNYKAASKFRLF